MKLFLFGKEYLLNVVGGTKASFGLNGSAILLIVVCFCIKAGFVICNY